MLCLCVVAARIVELLYLMRKEDKVLSPNTS